ncbi:MAG: energy transducer TonB [Sphingobium sp.]
MLFALLILLQQSGAAADYVESATAVSIFVGADGQARDCTVTQSSGAPELDAKVCPLILKHGRFTAKIDAHGTPIESSITTRIKWRLPREAAKP